MRDGVANGCLLFLSLTPHRYVGPLGRNQAKDAMRVGIFRIQLESFVRSGFGVRPAVAAQVEGSQLGANTRGFRVGGGGALQGCGAASAPEPEMLRMLASKSCTCLLYTSPSPRDS